MAIISSDHCTHCSTWKPVATEMGRCRWPMSTRAPLHRNSILRHHRWSDQPRRATTKTMSTTVIAWIWISFSSRTRWWCFGYCSQSMMIDDLWSIGYNNHSDRRAQYGRLISTVWLLFKMLCSQQLLTPSFRSCSLTLWRYVAHAAAAALIFKADLISGRWFSKRITIHYSVHGLFWPFSSWYGTSSTCNIS